MIGPDRDLERLARLARAELPAAQVAALERLDALDAIMQTLPGDVGSGWAPRDPDHDRTLTMRVRGVRTRQETSDDNENRVRRDVREWCRQRERLLPPESRHANEILVPDRAAQEDQGREAMAESTRDDIAWALVKGRLSVADLEAAFPSSAGRPTRRCLDARARVAPVLLGARQAGRTIPSIAAAFGRDEQQIKRFIQKCTAR